MTLPITVPYTFASATTDIPLSQLDSNFTTVTNGINGIGNGANQLANVSITGGTITGITPLGADAGGTGLATITANNVILGNGTGIVKVVAPGTTGNVLTSDGSTWKSQAAAAVAGVAAYGAATVSGGVLTNMQNSNGSFSRDSTGIFTFTFTSNLSAATYAVVPGIQNSTTSGVKWTSYANVAVSSFKVYSFDFNRNLTDPDGLSVVVYGS